jgi:hypothetical protein
VASWCRRPRGGHRGGARQGGEGRGAPERCADGEAAQTASGGRVAPVVVDERGEVLQLEGDLGVRRRQSIKEYGSSEGCSPEGGGRMAVTLGQGPA